MLVFCRYFGFFIIHNIQITEIGTLTSVLSLGEGEDERR